MSQSIKDLRHQKVESVARELSQNGYKVTIEPSSQDLPFALGNYQPGLVAFRDTQGGIILEVKTSHVRLSVERFQELAEEIATHKGWRFVLITLDDVIEELPIAEEDGFPSWRELATRISNSVTLLKMALLEPALLYLWGAVEVMLRKRAIVQKILIDRFSAKSLINHLYSAGEISMDEFDLLISIIEKRNKVAHGLVTNLTAKDLESLLETAFSLLGKWQDAS